MSHLRVDSFEDPRLDVYARLTEHQLRNTLEEGRGVMVAESRNVVSVALSAGLAPLSFLVDENHADVPEELLVQAGISADCPVYVLAQEQMEKLVGFRLTRGVLCALRRPAARTVSEVVAGARHVAVLEDLVDVTNVGALFRSAAALGADAVVLSPRCADPLCRRALRVSMGTVLQVPWARAEEGQWPSQTLGDLSGQGFDVCAMALTDDAVAIDGLGPASRRALLFGSEGFGLSEAALAASDRRVIIPMANGVDSLNVAASSAVAFWELFR